MDKDKKDNKNENFLRLTRRDFLKASAVVGVGTAASYLASKYDFDIFSKADTLNYEELQPGWQYSYVPSMCSICASVCDILVEVEQKNGYFRAVKIDGNPLSPWNKGKICARGQSGIFWAYNIDRLKTPLIRVGPKGTWAFKEATWEEAINYIKQKLQELKPYEIILIAGAVPDYKSYQGPFATSLGLLNFNRPPMQTCLFAEQFPIGQVIGGFDLHADDIMDDMTYSSLIIIWGNNAFPAGIFTGRAVRFGEGIANGAYVIAIDPRMGEAASKANMWIPIKPGTDLYIAMAIINYIIQNGYYDDNFVRYYTNAPFLAYEEDGVVKLLEEDWEDGTVKAFYVYDEITGQVVEVPPFTNTNKYDVNGNEIRPALSPQGLTVNGKQVQTVFQFLAQKVSNYTLEYAAQVADVPLSQLQELAYRIATMKPMVIGSGQSGNFNDQAVQFRKAVGIIMALTGNIDIRGGWVYSAAYREETKELVEVYNEMVQSGKIKPGILLQRPQVLSKVAPGVLGAIKTVLGLNNPANWPDGYPPILYAFNQNLKAQGKKPAGAFCYFMESGTYEAYQGKVTWNGQPYKPKVVISWAGSPFSLKWDNWQEIASNTFYILIDIMPRDQALYADVILPDVTYLERDAGFNTDKAALDYAIVGKWQAIPIVWPNTANGADLSVILAYTLFGKEAGDKYVSKLGGGNEIFTSIVQNEWPKYYEHLIQNNGYPPWGSFVAEAFREAQLASFSKKLNMSADQIYNTLRNNGVFITKTVDEYFSNNERIPWDLPAATPTGRIEIYSTIPYYYVIKNYGYDPTFDPIIAEIPPWWNGGYAVEPGVYHEPPSPYNDPTFKPTPPEMFYIEYKIPQFAYIRTNNPLQIAIASDSYHKNILMRAWINKETAQQLGINEGDWIVIERVLPNPDGTKPKLVIRAHLTELIRPDTIGVPRAFGQRNPGLTYASKVVNEFGNKPVDIMWAQGYNPLTGYHQAEQFTVYVRKATPEEIQEATQLASVSTPDTLPSKQAKVTPYTSVSQSEWSQYVSTGNVSTLG